ACYPCAGVTAWHALTWGNPLTPGSSVLVLGSGSVSLFALQFAKLFGARVIATTSSPAKAARLRELGADEIVNYREVPEWHRAVRDLTDGRGVDRAIDVGGATTLARSIAATMTDGHIALVGGLGGAAPLDPSALGGVFTLHRVSLGHRAHFEAMNRAVAFAQSRPVIDRVFTFDRARDAFAYYFERDVPGKVIIRVAA
ncbi:MAG TPA: NAD(P)-dependent alcohol dehydrogenase, partial [Candidatus Aquilonibacter sp.]